MFAFFLIVLCVPLVIAAAAFVFFNGISLKELGVIAVAQLIVAGIAAGVVSYENTTDTEVWNGRVTNKAKVPVPCEHSYDCNCHQVCSGSGKNKSCSEECDTCYKHHGFLRTIRGDDYDWDVYTTNQETVTIDRVDEQGVSQPPRWTIINVGDPTSLTHGYDSYIKASPDTLFRHQGLKDKYATSIPTYPQHVYDYYHLDRLVTVGVSVDDATAWNTALTELNADLGKSKQANMIVVLVKNVSDEYYYALEESWIGGKKNDVILVVDVDDQMKPQWASVMCWTTNELFKVKLRDDVMNDPIITRKAIIDDLHVNVDKYFERKPMKDFEYLKSSIVPTTTEWVVTMVIGLVIAIGLIVFFQMNDVFDEGPSQQRRGLSVSGFHGRRMPWQKRIKRIFNTRTWEDV